MPTSSGASGLAADAGMTGATGSKSSAQGSQLYGESQPGFNQALHYYSDLASGNPAAIQKAIAPAVNNIDQQFNREQQASQYNRARGGAEGDLNRSVSNARSAAVGNAELTTANQAPGQLASISGQGLGISQEALSNAISAFANAGYLNQGLAQQQSQGKASTMGALSSIAMAGAGA